MDEVDIDDVDDLNDLEARLYAQIHHESANAVEFDNSSATYKITEEVPTAPTTVRTVTSTSVINKAVSDKTGRYWNDRDTARGQNFGKQPTGIKGKDQRASQGKVANAGAVQTMSSAVETVAIANDKDDGQKFGSAKVQNICVVQSDPTKATNTNKSTDAKLSKTTSNSKSAGSGLALPKAQVPKPKAPAVKPTPTDKTSNQSSDKNSIKTNQPHQHQNLTRNTNKDLRFNPASKKKQQTQKDQLAPAVNILKNGPFGKQVQKLNKAIRIEAKRQKSKIARIKSRQQMRPVETIELESTNESDDDDVIAVPMPVPPTYTIDDSDEEKKSKIVIKDLIEIEEHAQDAADIDLDTSLEKMQMTAAGRDEQQVQQQNASRCTSPCSVLSSDDFIGQNDRCRLLENSGMADDEDLIMLTADVDSLMETPTTSKQAAQKLAKSRQPIEESSNDVECTQFIVPTNSKKTKNQYRVEQTQFRALDVYESESDIADSVYTRAAKSNKQTIIRSLSSSDDDNCIESVVVLRPKNKRLRKRSTSGKNKETDTNIEVASTDSEQDACKESGVTPTPVPFIARGPAVERSIDSLSICTSRRASAGGSGSVGQMSDSEFIATLNNLAQAGNEDDDDDEHSDDAENVAIPSARAIAEQVLADSNRNDPNTNTEHDVEMEQCTAEEETTSNSREQAAVSSASQRNAAVPEDAMSHLSNIFETIDNLDKRKRTDIISSESEPEVEVVNEGALVGMASPLDDSRRRNLKMNRETGDPVYNIVYSEEKRVVGGLGWNDEMRRFYNDSWNGENFNVRSILSSMDANKNLWKIYTEDRFPKSRRFTNLKCHNCCEFGHTRAKCTLPRKPLTCYMCGERGHYEPRCPNTICLRCGNKTHVFTKSCNACSFQNRLICPVCKVRGHTLNLCPDKWRRYHSTTEPNKYPNSEVEYKRKKCCCVCGGRGHLSDTCKSAVRFLEYPIVVSDIKSHQKSYNDQSFRGSISGIAFNLLYKPDQDVSFELAENTTRQNYYGRFLHAVSMGFLLKRKRKVKTLTCNTPIKQAKTHKNYVTNPYSKAGQQARNSSNAPEQVQEVSESGKVENSPQDVEVIELDTPIETENMLTSNETMEEEDESEEPTESVGTLIQEPERSNAFKAPEVIAVNAQPQTPKETENPVLDSDSNYSFSEHFEMPTATETTAAAEPTEAIDEAVDIDESADLDESANVNVSANVNESTNVTSQPSDATENAHTNERLTQTSQPRPKPREMEPLPDFIPLNAAQQDYDDDDDDNDDEYDANLDVGISRKYVTAESDDDDDETHTNTTLLDLPCEAKIYLTHFHSRYLLSPIGHKFLVEKSKECEIKARLDWTSVGHVLIIYGLQSNQDRFHRELLLKYRQLTDQMNQRDIPGVVKVPRRVDALIRFLRANIMQLMKNLGNANEHLNRLKTIEERPTSKTSLKLAEKARRSLNMIILGQAGLRDGNFHLDKLILSLQKLINDYNSDDMASNELRDEIDSHWKVIFTPYRHDNYPELVQHYNKMITKNRIPKLNIDPVLLGGSVLSFNINPTPKEHKTPTPLVKEKKRISIVPNPLNPKNSKKPPTCNSPPPPAPSMRAAPNSSDIPPAPSMKLPRPVKSNQLATDFVPHTNLLKLKNVSTPSHTLVNPQQKSTTVAVKIREATQKWETTCDSLLSKIDDGDPKKSGGPERDCKAPSMFWSRESIKYIDECISRATNADGNLIEKLQRVQKKSQSGLLSYNDYRAVIRIHNTILGK